MFKPEMYAEKKKKKAVQLKKEGLGGLDLTVTWSNWDQETGEKILQQKEIIVLSDLQDLKVKYQVMIDSIDALITDLSVIP